MTGVFRGCYGASVRRALRPRQLLSPPPLAAAFVIAVPLWLVGCDGCRRPAAPNNSAARYVSSANDLVLVGDVDLGPQIFASWQRLIQVLSTDAQREQARRELALSLGFDPLDLGALLSAGLDPDGQWAAGWSAEREQWVVALPASDVAKLQDTLVDLGRRRFGAEARVEGGATKLVTSFGPEDVERAAIRTQDRVVLWVSGSEAGQTLAALQPLEPAASAASLAASDAQLAGRANIDGPALIAAARDARIRDGERIAGLIETWTRRFEFSANFSEAGLGLKGRLALTDAGRELLTKARPPSFAASSAVRAAAVPDAILVAAGALEPEVVFDTLIPPGSETRKGIEEAREQGRLLIDIEKEIIPALSGALAASVGAGDLSALTFRELVGAPQKVLWSAFAVGRRPEAESSPYEALLEAAGSAQGVDVETRPVDDVEVTSFRTADTLVTEVAELEQAWFAANEPAVMNRVIARRDQSDAAALPLLEVEARFGELHRILQTFRAGSLPLFVRATWAQILDAIELLGTAHLKAEARDDALGVQVDLRLRPPADSTKAP